MLTEEQILERNKLIGENGIIYYLVEYIIDHV